MAKSREINMNLPSADDLFTTQEERDHKNQEYVKEISIYGITDFPTCQRETNRWIRNDLRSSQENGK